MPCEKMSELENAWKSHYEAANYFEWSPAIADLPMAKERLMLLIRERRADQARTAYSILTHQRHCPICGEKRLGSAFTA